MPASATSPIFRILAPSTAGMDSRNAKRTANRRSMPRKQPMEMVMPDREMPGHVAMACPAPTISTSAKVALFSVFLPLRMRSQPKSSAPVTSSAIPTKMVLLYSASTMWRKGRMTNSGSVPTMMSRISRRAGGTERGTVPWATSPIMRKNSRTISRMSSQ